MPAARGLEFIADGVLSEAISRAPPDHFVIWTGHAYSSWQTSLRSRALARITEVGEPVPLRELLRRAARIDGDLGFDPDTVRSGLRLHQGAKPAVYLLVERNDAGDYTAVTDIPYAGPAFRRITRGAVVLDGAGRLIVEGVRLPTSAKLTAAQRPLAYHDVQRHPSVRPEPPAPQQEMGSVPRSVGASAPNRTPPAAATALFDIHKPRLVEDAARLSFWRNEDLASDRPRALRDGDARMRRRAMLALPHMQPLATFAERLRLARPGTEVPDFDPLDGGVNAQALFLFEKPGPMAGSSGFISRNNDDRTAEATFQFMRAADLPREATCLWNAVPWWNGTREVSAAELQEGADSALELMQLLPHLRVAILVGLRAGKIARELRQRGLAVLVSYHPSPINRAAAPAKWNAIPADWARAKAHLR
ncbi:uracil-DNA glycosylase [Roseomonas sp. AR75]|uniref:uracil-DNA glycosylase n=1 Tax=Roseomonas sp. AR75 TaxID=2562311 RepID=UPI001980FA79|nr:uracil-DNA glycosylase [Roseomonas sp. AR75]